MADNVTANAGSGGAVFATDDDGTAHHPYVKLEWGADNTQTKVAAGAGALPIQDGGNSITVDGSLTVDLGVNNDVTVTGTVDLGATDNAVLDAIAASVAAIDGDTNSLAVVGGGLEATAVRVTLANDSTGVLSVDDNGGALTVDGTVTANLAAGTNNIGDVDVLTIAAGDNNIGNVDIVTVPTDPFGANADAASATGSISAKLRFIASTGIPITGTVTVGSHEVTNAGTFAVQESGSALTALQVIDNPVLVDDAAFTPATSSVMMAGFEADESSTDSVDEGDAGAARMTLDRKQIVTPQPHSAGGLTIFRSIDLDESEEEVSSVACSVYGVWVTNTATSTRWIKFYNATAANTTVGTTTPVITIGIPGNTSDDVSGNFGPGGMGISFGTALSVAATTGVADADTGAPAANDVIINIFYK